MPCSPNMSSSIKLITNEKTSHLRELVINQKNKKSSKNNLSNKRNKHIYYNANKCSKTNKNFITNAYECGNTVPDSNARVHNNSTCTIDYNCRGYDYVKRKSKSSQKSVVTEKLKKYIENLCNDSEVNFNESIGDN